MGVCSSKWKKPWRRSSKSGDSGCHEKILARMSFDDVVEAVMRAPLKDFQALRKEWAATRIQAAFRVFLARRALRALRGVVKLQAMFRGQRVRSQTLMTFQCMESLVRAQKRVRVHHVRMDAEARRKMAGSKSAKESVPALKSVSEKGRRHHDIFTGGYTCLERSKSSKPSETEHPKTHKTPNLAAIRSCSDPGRLKEKNLRGWLASTTSQIGYNAVSAAAASSSSSSMSSSSQSESEATGEARSSYQPKSDCSQKLKRLFREIQDEIDTMRNGGDSLDWLINGSADGSEKMNAYNC